MKKIMAVDDSPTVRTILNAILLDAGYEVVMACNGQEAVEKLARNDIDLMVTDLNMPGMDGLELIKHVRHNPGTPFVPIVMLTSATQPDVKDEGEKAGATGWVNKPFRTKQLLSVVQALCPV